MLALLPQADGAFIFTSGNVQRCSWKTGGDDADAPTWSMVPGVITTLPVYTEEEAIKAAEEARKARARAPAAPYQSQYHEKVDSWEKKARILSTRQIGERAHRL